MNQNLSTTDTNGSLTKRCKDCGLVKAHILKAKHASSNYYVDDTGSRWRGNRCYPCTKSDHKSITAWGLKQHRQCRVCTKPLSLDRYFNCKECVQTGLTDRHNLEGEYVYG